MRVRFVCRFREWDDDGSGTIDKKEFRKALQALGVTASKAELDALFDTFDADGGGTLEYGEINKALRRGGTVHLDASLKPGAAVRVGVLQLPTLTNTLTHTHGEGSPRFVYSAALRVERRPICPLRMTPPPLLAVHARLRARAGRHRAEGEE